MRCDRGCVGLRGHARLFRGMLLRIGHKLGGGLTELNWLISQWISKARVLDGPLGDQSRRKKPSTTVPWTEGRACLRCWFGSALAGGDQASRVKRWLTTVAKTKSCRSTRRRELYAGSVCRIGSKLQLFVPDGLDAVRHLSNCARAEGCCAATDVIYCCSNLIEGEYGGQGNVRRCSDNGSHLLPVRCHPSWWNGGEAPRQKSCCGGPARRAPSLSRSVLV